MEARCGEGGRTNHSIVQDELAEQYRCYGSQERAQLTFFSPRSSGGEGCGGGRRTRDEPILLPASTNIIIGLIPKI